MLSLHIRQADAVTHSNINALMPKIGIKGTLNNWQFTGDPNTIQNLRYHLSAADWQIVDSASFRAYTPPVAEANRVEKSFEECLKIIANAVNRGQKSAVNPVYHYQSAVIC